MRIYTLASFLVLTAFSQMVFSEDKATEDNSGVSGQIRFGYTNTEDGTGNSVESAAIGGKLGYVSPSWNGISVGATGYTTNALGNLDDDGFFLNSRGGPNGEGYSIIGELWLQAEFANTAIKIGRQEIDTPFADTDDIGMIPDTFEGVVITNTSLANTTITAMHLDKGAGVDAPIPEKFTDLTDKGDGVSALGVSYETDKWNAQFWHYKQDNNAGNATNITYVEAGINPLENLELGVQYANESYAVGGNAKVWGAEASYGMGDFTVTADYNKVSGDNGIQGTIGGIGGGPFFTSAEQNIIDDTANIKAKAIGIEYSGIKNLALSVRKVNFDQGVSDELDLTADYQIRDNLTAQLIYSDMDEAGKNTRFFVNYNFDI